MKKLLIISLLSIAGIANAGIIADTPSGWFVSADQKNGITFGDGDFSKNLSFTMYVGEILTGGKCNIADKKCHSFSGEAKPAGVGKYTYDSPNCKFSIVEKKRDILITDVVGCGKDGYKISEMYLAVGI